MVCFAHFVETQFHSLVAEEFTGFPNDRGFSL
jgi:hypothetical protein